MRDRASLRSPRAADADRKAIFPLVCDMEEPLNRARALTQALQLMGFGLRGIHDDTGPSLLAIAEAIASQLDTAKNAWRRIAAATGAQAGRSKPRKRGARTS
jgi:hypothetical protein